MLEDNIDCDKQASEFANTLPAHRQEHFPRLNPFVVHGYTGLDVVDRLEEMRDCIYRGWFLEECDAAFYTLVASSFYLRLDAVPRKHGERYYCQGS